MNSRPGTTVGKRVTRQPQNRLLYIDGGEAFEDEIEARKMIGGFSKSWSYSTHLFSYCNVLRYDFENGEKSFQVISFIDGLWYIRLPDPPYQLYNQFELSSFDTVYVCEGEKTANAAYQIGLNSTTSLCGPKKAAMSDWSPLQDKHVVILRDFDEEGMRYAQDVAQLALQAGARSARIVTLPGLNVGEDLVEWIGDRTGKHEHAALRAEIEAMARAAPNVERQLSDGTQTELHCLSDVTSETRPWILNGVIPCGTLTVITGQPGVGKSLFTLGVAASVTRGNRGPVVGLQKDCDRYETIANHRIIIEESSVSVSNFQAINPAAVLLFSASDDLAHTIRPRLEAASANLSLVYAVRGVRSSEISAGQFHNWAFPLDHELAALETKLERLVNDGVVVRMIVIDPVDRFFGQTDSHFDATELVSRLTDLANRSGAAVVLVAENVPLQNSKVRVRRNRHSAIVDSITAAARSIWTVVRDSEHPNRRHLLPIKTNLCECQIGPSFSIQDGALEWIADETSLTTIQKQVDEEKSLPDQGTELYRAIVWLNDQLSFGPVCSENLKKDAKENAFSPATLRRAHHWLGVKSDKVEGKAAWNWYLKNQSPSLIKAIQRNVNSPLLEVEATCCGDQICLEVIRDAVAG